MKSINFFRSERSQEIVRYLIIGITTTAVNFIATFLFNVIMPFGIASAIAVIISVIYAYVTNKVIVFRSRVDTKRAFWHEMGAFFMSRAATIALEIGGVPLIALLVGDWWSKIAWNIVIIILNYILARVFVFMKATSAPTTLYTNMKIIHLISGNDTGGAKTYILNLLKHLEDVLLVCIGEGDLYEAALLQQTPAATIGSQRELKLLLHNINPAILHTHGARANYMATRLPKKNRPILISTVHRDYKCEYLGRPLHAISRGTLNARALRKMDYLAGVSTATKNILIQRGFSAENIFVAHGGIEFNNTVTHAKPEAAKSVVFGIMARLEPAKNIETLLHAAAIARNNCAMRILIAGDGADREHLAAITAQLQLDDIVTFLGWVDTPIYNNIDVNVLTSHHEGFPMALLEGANHSLATIATCVDGIPDLITHKENGLLFEPGDTAMLAEYMVMLANDSVLRRQLGDALYLTASTKFSATVCADKHRQMYKTILNHEA